MLTNFTGFHFFRNGQKVKSCNIAEDGLAYINRPPKPKNLGVLRGIFDLFLSFSTPPITGAHDLAVELANKTQLLKRIMIEELDMCSASICEIYEVFKEKLISDLKQSDFADTYAQTIAYGLFFARMQAKENGFSRSNAYSYVPISIPALLT